MAGARLSLRVHRQPIHILSRTHDSGSTFVSAARSHGACNLFYHTGSLLRASQRHSYLSFTGAEPSSGVGAIAARTSLLPATATATITLLCRLASDGRLSTKSGHSGTFCCSAKRPSPVSSKSSPTPPVKGSHRIALSLANTQLEWLAPPTSLSISDSPLAYDHYVPVCPCKSIARTHSRVSHQPPTSQCK